MGSTSRFTKDPDAVLDYQIDWSTWLGGDTISTSTWSVASGDVTIDSDTNTTTTATVWLSAGTAPTTAEVRNRITTAGLRTVDRTLTISVRER